MEIIEPAYESQFNVITIPQWLLDLEDQRVRVGNSLLYQMGDNTNQFGEETKVTIELESAEAQFINYSPDSNTIVIVGSQLGSEQVGRWRVTVVSEYVDPLGRYNKFKNDFTIEVYEDKEKADEVEEIVDQNNDTEPD